MALKSSAGALMLRSAAVCVDDDNDYDRTDHALYPLHIHEGYNMHAHRIFDDVR